MLLEAPRVQYEVRNPRLWEFHQDRSKVDERFLLAGTGGGKTYGACYEDLHITFTEPAGVGILAAPDFPQLKRTFYPTLAALLGKPIDQLGTVATFNKSDKRLEWWNGWVWHFVTMDKPNSVEGLPDGVFVHATELRLMRNFSDEDGPWMNLTRRLRGKEERPRYAYGDTHSPTKAIMDHINADPVNRRAYSWGTQDAVKWGTLSARDGQRLAAGYSGSAAERILQGRYARPTGLVYDAFERSRNLRAWNGKRPTRWTYGVDLGWTHPAVVTAHAWYGDTVHTVREAVLDKPGIPGVVASVRKMQAELGHGTAWVGYDVRAGEAVQEMKALGLDAREFQGRVREGVLMLNSRLQGGAWLVDEVGCPRLVEEFDLYEWKRGAVEEPEKGDEDALDSARYGILGSAKDDRGFVL